MALEANIPELLCRAQSIDIPTVTQADSQSNGFVHASENVCMCMYMHKDMSTCLHTSCTCANIYVHACYAHARVRGVYAHMYTHTHLYTHSHMYAHTHKHTYMHARAHTHTHVRTYVHTYIHACIHTYIHTYIHTFVHTSLLR